MARSKKNPQVACYYCNEVHDPIPGGCAAEIAFDARIAREGKIENLRDNLGCTIDMAMHLVDLQEKIEELAQQIKAQGETLLAELETLRKPRPFSSLT